MMFKRCVFDVILSQLLLSFGLALCACLLSSVLLCGDFSLAASVLASRTQSSLHVTLSNQVALTLLKPTK